MYHENINVVCKKRKLNWVIDYANLIYFIGFLLYIQIIWYVFLNHDVFQCVWKLCINLNSLIRCLFAVIYIFFNNLSLLSKSSLYAKYIYNVFWNTMVFFPNKYITIESFPYRDGGKLNIHESELLNDLKLTICICICNRHIVPTVSSWLCLFFCWPEGIWK